MTGRLIATVAALALMSGHGFSAFMLPFDAQRNTWSTTHIVVVEGGKVVESWKGDLKVGELRYPKGSRGTRGFPYPVRTRGSKLSGEKPPVVSGKRMVLFLTFGPQQDKDPTTRSGRAPTCRATRPGAVGDGRRLGRGRRGVLRLPADQPGGLCARHDGGIAGLKQLVDVGLAIRAQFEAAKADPDPGRRAERLAALTPIVANYARYSGKSECIGEVSRCGPAAVPHLAQWATEPTGEYVDLAIHALCGLGDVGFDAVVKLLDDEVRQWKQVADGLKPGESVRESPRTGLYWWRGPHHFHRLLRATRSMKLSEGNRERLRTHPGLRELDQLLTTKPGMKPEKSNMANAHEVLRDILAGKIGAK